MTLILRADHSHGSHDDAPFLGLDTTRSARSIHTRRDATRREPSLTHPSTSCANLASGGRGLLAPTVGRSGMPNGYGRRPYDPGTASSGQGYPPWTASPQSLRQSSPATCSAMPPTNSGAMCWYRVVMAI